MNVKVLSLLWRLSASAIRTASQMLQHAADGDN